MYMQCYSSRSYNMHNFCSLLEIAPLLHMVQIPLHDPFAKAILF